MTTAEDSIIAQALSILDARLKSTSFMFTSPDSVKQYLRLHLQGKEREFFGVMLLNGQHQLICFEIIHAGTISSVAVYPRETVKLALQHNAAAVIFAHNHPSGSTEPSHADKAITARLKQALELVDVRALDHLIVAGNEVVSMAESGHF